MTLLLGALVAIAPLAMDVYLPSMPAMTRALATSPEAVQLTVTLYMFAWGVAQLFAGPLSDRYGRRPALLAGLVLFVAASLVCMLAADIGTLIAGRVLQAVAVATVAVVPRAVVRDLHAGDRAAHMLSTMMMVLAVAPVLAPILGAQIHVAFGWRASFVLVGLYGVLALATVWFLLPETLAHRDARALDPARMAANWMRVLRSRRFVALMLTCAFAICGLFAFLAGSAFVFVQVMGAGERSFGFYFALVMAGNFLGALLARRLVIGAGLERIVALGTWLLLGAGLAMAALAWAGVAHPLAVVIPMFAYMAAYMWTVPQATAGALTPHPEIAGSVSSLLSFAQFVIAAGAALAVGLAFDGTSRPMATGIALSGLGAFVAFRLRGRG
jgi:DHA1 family bicyclomycin/chloramphenicol resistance-like MFS transporter